MRKVSTISSVAISAIIDLMLPATSLVGFFGAVAACSVIDFSVERDTGGELEFAGFGVSGGSGV